MNEVLSTQGPIALQYGGGQGHAALRERLVELMAEEGVAADPEDVVVTTGAQQALDLIGKIFIDPGDLIAVEAPAYVGALTAFGAYEPRFLQIDLDDDGMVVDRLEEALLRGGRPKFVDTVPNFGNPAGCDSLTRKTHAARIALPGGVETERYFAGDRWRKNLDTLVATYRERRDAMLDAIAETFPGAASWTRPAGGFYVWVTLPNWVDTRSLLAAAVERRVAYVPGTAFYPDGRGKNQVRLAFCYPEVDRILEGIARLGSLLEDEEQLYGSLHP